MRFFIRFMVYRANGKLGKRFIENQIGYELTKSLAKALQSLGLFLYSLQDQLQDGPRFVPHTIDKSNEIRTNLFALESTIKVFKAIRDGPNPEYFSKRKDTLLRSLEEIISAMD